jgi:3-hydroxymyristoyl/3-hydroxydecanoyl-(acyl carrier protein) dehydratase
VDGPAMGSLLRNESPVGTSALVAYDVPQDAWFFDATAQSSGQTMPFSVLLEVALQPCGWVSSYVGSALTTDEDLCYRNLDGTGTLHREVPRDCGTLLARATLLKSSSSSGMIIQELAFAVTLADGTPIYDGTTVFGFFPLSAFERQAGVGSTEAERARLRQVSAGAPLDAGARVPRTQLQVPAPPLLMIDRIADLDMVAGRIRTEKDVDPAEWFFRAHFYEDPVQPGSLGIEAMVQALQQLAMRTGADAGMRAPRFEALATGTKHSWKYRGQVVPKNRRIDVEVELKERVQDARGVTLCARGSLWVDGLKIYTAEDLAVRVVETG